MLHIEYIVSKMKGVYFYTALLVYSALVVLMQSTVTANRTCVDTEDTGRLNFELLVDVLGVPGPVGPEGQKGQKGELGVQGRTGVRGETGQKGEPGDVGPVGPQGDKGEKGRRGEKGDLGLQGLQGIQGPVGLHGPIGREGPQGPEGPEGPQGVPGPTGSRGPRGLQGIKGSQGIPGSAGPRGVQGPQGVQGIPGDTVLTSEEFTNVCQNVSEKVLDGLAMKLERMERDIDSLKSVNTHTKCGILDVNWRRIANLNMTQPSARCPLNLTEHSNSSTGQRACGRSSGPGCSSVIFTSQGNYSQVCGQIAGYELGSMDSFHPNQNDDKTINDVYVDGISITHGNPRQHLWTYAVGLQEAALRTVLYQCPGDRADYPASRIPDFVGNDYYCETGWVSSYRNGRHVWDDPLWDGKGCHLSTAHSCDRYGWFHKQVNTTTDYIEVRLCSDQGTSNEDVLAELIEIWVL